MRRAGVTDDAQYAAGLTGMLNTTINAPGRYFFSPYDMSLQAPFVDAATSVDPQNRANTFISYYTWGAAIGLGLDLSIRSRFPGLALDDFMRAMWQTFGVHEADYTPQRPYTMDDLRVTLGTVVRDTAFANDFFRRYINGREVVDYTSLVGLAGILLRPAQPGLPDIGAAQLEVRDGVVRTAGPVLVGSSLYAAGVSAGDRIIALDGQPVSTAEAVQGIVAGKRPGEPIGIRFEQRGVERTASVTVGEIDALEVVLYEDAGMDVTPVMREFRASWLGTKSQ
ncbi:hypothetical protein BH23GEM9_BH23GEM9_00610 [soil metagenome]